MYPLADWNSSPQPSTPDRAAHHELRHPLNHHARAHQTEHLALYPPGDVTAADLSAELRHLLRTATAEQLQQVVRTAQAEQQVRAICSTDQSNSRSRLEALEKGIANALASHRGDLGKDFGELAGKKDAYDVSTAGKERGLVECVVSDLGDLLRAAVEEKEVRVRAQRTAAELQRQMAEMFEMVEREAWVCGLHPSLYLCDVCARRRKLSNLNSPIHRHMHNGGRCRRNLVKLSAP
jgi:hypothetical protein